MTLPYQQFQIKISLKRTKKTTNKNTVHVMFVCSVCTYEYATEYGI